MHRRPSIDALIAREAALQQECSAVRVQIGDALREVRELAGVSLTATAREAAMPASDLSLLERGLGRYSPENVRKVRDTVARMSRAKQRARRYAV